MEGGPQNECSFVVSAVVSYASGFPYGEERCGVELPVQQSTLLMLGKKKRY